MADKQRPQEKEGTPEQPSRGGRLKPIIVIALLMLVEGVGIFVLMKVVSPAPQSAAAAEGQDSLDDPFKLAEQVEVPLCDISAFNRKEGRLYVYNAQISALVAAKDREKIDRFIKARELSIKDRVQLVFRSADPKDLNDPGLKTIKRQLRFEINNLLGGKELIQDVLIPKLLQSRANL